MKSRCLLIPFLVFMAVLTVFTGCIKLTVPKNSSSTSTTTTPSTTTPDSSSTTGPSVPASRPVINSFYATPSSAPIGTAITLRWEISGADIVSITPDVGNVPAFGSRTVLPAQTTVYTLTATNPAGSNMASTQVVVSTSSTAPAQPYTPTPTPSYSQPVINYFNVSPAIIDMGEYTTMTWSVSNATSVTITPGIGNVSSSGSLPVQPSQNMTFTILATGPGGSATASTAIKVSVYPPSTPSNVSWTGTWQLTTTRGWEGKMFLTQAGNSVTGTYEYQNGHVTNGSISNSGLTLTATWSEEPTYAPPDDQGSFIVTMDPGGNSWGGTWLYSPSSVHDGGSFQATRIR